LSGAGQQLDAGGVTIGGRGRNVDGVNPMTRGSAAASRGLRPTVGGGGAGARKSVAPGHLDHRSR
jgi:hypothetical protein